MANRNMQDRQIIGRCFSGKILCQAPKTQIPPSIQHICVAYELSAASYTRDRTFGKPRAIGAFLRSEGTR
jgi:hypothetical protein